MMNENTPKIMAQSLTSLAQQYAVSTDTMRKWLLKAKLIKKEGEGYIYTPKEVRAIYEHLGTP